MLVSRPYQVIGFLLLLSTSLPVSATSYNAFLNLGYKLQMHVDAIGQPLELVLTRGKKQVHISKERVVENYANDEDTIMHKITASLMAGTPLAEPTTHPFPIIIIPRLSHLGEDTGALYLYLGGKFIKGEVGFAVKAKHKKTVGFTYSSGGLSAGELEDYYPANYPFLKIESPNKVYTLANDDWQLVELPKMVIKPAVEKKQKNWRMAAKWFSHSDDQ